MLGNMLLSGTVSEQIQIWDIMFIFLQVSNNAW